MATKVGGGTWLKDGEDKRRSVQAMFADIAPTYDLMNSLMCFRLHYRWRKLAVQQLGLQPGCSAADICCGTGDFLVPLQQAVGVQGKVVGVDFCAPMLEVAKHKTKSSKLLVGDACSLPLATDQYDGVTVGWGLRNVPSLSAAIREIHRILKPGGRFVSLDMARPKGLGGKLSEGVFHTFVPVLGTLLGKREAYQYLPQSTVRFVGPEELKDQLSLAGFTELGHRTLFFGNIAMVWGRKP